MILTILFGAVALIINLLLKLFPDISLDFSLFSSALGEMVKLLKAGAGIFFFFVPREVVAFALPLAIAIINFELIYDAVMWVIRKIPFINMK